MFATGAALAVWLSVVGSAAAQQPDEREASLRLSGEMELARLIDMAAEAKGVPVQYTGSLGNARVTIRDTGELTYDHLWRLTSSVMQAQGFVTVELAGGHGLFVTPVSEAKARARIMTPDEHSLASFRNVLIPLQWASAQRVVDQLGPLLTPSLGLAEPLDRAVLISDMSARLKDIDSLLAALDQPANRAETRVIELAHISAIDAAAQFTQMSGTPTRGASVQGSGMRVTALGDGSRLLIAGPSAEVDRVEETIRSLDRPPATRTVVYPIQGFALSEVSELLTSSVETTNSGWKLVEDRLSNALVITASADLHDSVEFTLARLNAIPADQRRPSRTFVVQNRAVSEVADVLGQLIETGVVIPTGEAGSDLDAGSSLGTPGVKLTVDEGSNSIFASAPSPVLDQIERLLPSLDVRLPQVQVEVMLVSLSESQSRDLGVELQKLLDDAGTLVGLSSLFGLGTPAIDAINPLIGGSGSSVVVLDPGDFSVVVRALESVNDGRTLSMPKVLVNNNEDATIDSVLQQPFISTNAGDTISTTSFGGFEDAGTQVTVTPQIAAGDHLVLRYSINLSSFVGDSASPEAPPPRQQNSISSVATIPDGFTVVVGGIELQTEGYGEDRLPVLGRIPLVGNLFKSTSKSSSRQRFFAFIRATTMRDSGFEELKYLSGAAVGEAGIDDGWPEVAPRIIR